MESLNLSWQIIRQGTFALAGRQVSAAEVIERLAPHLTDERKARIHQVAMGRTYNVATVTEHIYDVGNVSAVMRSAESFGFLPFHIIETPDGKYKMSDRISKGTEKWLDIHRYKSGDLTTESGCFKRLRDQGYKVYATDLNATVDIKDLNFSEPVAIVFGNEHAGITEKVRSTADGTFRIPMHGFAQSFNISVAAALTFQTIHRARVEQLGKGSGDLTSAELQNLVAQYYLRTLDSAEKYFG